MLVVFTGRAGKVKEMGQRRTTGPAPVPVRLTVWVGGLALSVMVRAPVLVPLAVGLKVTLIVQEALAARVERQLLLCEKSPLTVMREILRVALPVFLSVMPWALLLEPTVTVRKVSEAGERLTTGATTPVPVRLTA